jgi:hypothetical protein
MYAEYAWVERGCQRVAEEEFGPMKTVSIPVPRSRAGDRMMKNVELTETVERLSALSLLGECVVKRSSPGVGQPAGSVLKDQGRPGW